MMTYMDLSSLPLGTRRAILAWAPLAWCNAIEHIAWLGFLETINLEGELSWWTHLLFLELYIQLKSSESWNCSTPDVEKNFISIKLSWKEASMFMPLVDVEIIVGVIAYFLVDIEVWTGSLVQILNSLVAPGHIRTIIICGVVHKIVWSRKANT